MKKKRIPNTFLNYMQKQKLKTLVKLFLIYIFLIPLLTELGLRILAKFEIIQSFRGRVNVNFVPNPNLGYKVPPNSLPDIDKNGFRNYKNIRLSEIEIFAIGDSQTYGYNASIDQSWPSKLSEYINLDIYNYGIGGYGLTQYKFFLDKTLKIKNSTSIVGLYPPNDFCGLLKIKEPDVSLRAHILRNSEFFMAIRSLNKISNFISANRDIIKAKFSNRYAILKSNKNNQHIVVNTSRSKCLNSANKSVINAFDYFKKDVLYRKLNNQSVIYLLIPSKGIIYEPSSKVIHNKTGYSYYLRKHKETFNKIMKFLDKENIRYSYPLTKLQEHATKESQPLFLRSSDEHPLSEGYRIYAESLYKHFVD